MTNANLAETAQAMVAPGKGILAADESTPTIGKRFAGIGVESTEPLRRDYRSMLFSAPEADRHIGGVFYLFVRGMSPEVSGNGVYRDAPTRECIEAISGCVSGSAP